MRFGEVSKWCSSAALLWVVACGSGGGEADDPVTNPTLPEQPQGTGDSSGGAPPVTNGTGGGGDSVVSPPGPPGSSGSTSQPPGVSPNVGPPAGNAGGPAVTPPGPGGGAGNEPNPNPEPAPGPGSMAGMNGGGSGPGPVEPVGTCTIDVTSSISENISTVGIVEFSTDVASPGEAHIEFGPDTNYGMAAPVDLAEPNYRTLILGMKPSSTYHARVVVDGCAGADFTLETGQPPTGLPDVEINTPDPSKAMGGFLVTGTYQTGPAYIMDGDGDFVWWHLNEGEVTRALMSYDGKHMWYAKGNVPQGQAKVVRVAMDGSGREDLSSQFRNLNHDLTVLPDGSVVFIAYGSNGCDDIVEWSPNGSTRVLGNTGEILGVGMCHCNALQYSAEDDTVVVSELDQSAYIKLSRSGEVVWILGGGGNNAFTGDGASWQRQHGLDILGLDRILIFNNGQMGGGPGSLAIEIQLDLGSMTATRVWEYAAMPAIQNAIMGDVQRLENGNTLVTYSTQGIIHEVAPDLSLVQSLTWGIGGAVGYTTKRATLYGPPPKVRMSAAAARR